MRGVVRDESDVDLVGISAVADGSGRRRGLAGGGTSKLHSIILDPVKIN